MDIQDLTIFARVAALQNLSAVGAEMGLTAGTISKRIQALEDQLSVRLFDRTTRSIRITEEGQIFLGHVSRALAEIEQGRAQVEDNVARPRGKLKIAAPCTTGCRALAPAISAFMHQYPEIEVQIDLSDRTVNMQEEGYDVAIRCGVLPDCTLIAKRLAPDPHVLAAAPSYLAEHGTPSEPGQLEQHSCLTLCDQSHWSFVGRDGERTVRVCGRLKSSSADLLHQAAIDGLGIVCTSATRLAGDLAAGRLVRLLPDYDVAGDPAIWAVYPSSKHVLPRLRVLLDFLAEWFREPAPARAASANLAVVPSAGAHVGAQRRSMAG